MPREKMDGGNLRDGVMEVAFEQWTERTVNLIRVDFNCIPGVIWERYRKHALAGFPYRQRAKRRLFEFRW